MKRRNFLTTIAALSTVRSPLLAANLANANVGICTFSCHLHWQAVRSKTPGTAFSDTLGFYDYVRELGFDGVQTSFRELDSAAMKSLRTKVEKDGAYLEGDLRLPKSKSDLDDFEREVRWTRELGATVARSIFTSGRRYETFKTMDDFRAFHRDAQQRLALVEPIVAKHQLKLAVENHKDFTLDEQLELLKKIDSQWIGALVDTGNNIALLDEPYRVIEALAPFALSVHLKDMAVQSDRDGFLLSEVPCGTGFLDMPRIIKTLHVANPKIVFNLEMATRDPLRVPCFTDPYWVTFPERRATHLDAVMKLVQQNPIKQPPPSIVGASLEQQLLDEESNNRVSLEWMHRNIG